MLWFVMLATAGDTAPSARALLPQTVAPQHHSPLTVVWTSSNGAERKTHGLFWSHIPKTSTTFGRTVFAYACHPPETFANVSTHYPPQPEAGTCDRLSRQQNELVDEVARARHLDQAAHPTPVPTRNRVTTRTWYHLGVPTESEPIIRVAPGVSIVTLLRKPAMRIRSEFRMMMTCAPYDLDRCRAGPGTNNATGTSWGWERSVRARALLAINETARRNPNASEYESAQSYASALAPENGLWGCQTKMLLGYGCHEAHEPTLAEREHAMRLVRGIEPGMAFVGLIERYAESVCLFHAIHGGPLFAFEVEHNSSRAMKEPSSSADSVFEGGSADPDVELYTLAADRFEREVREHRSEMESCLSSLALPTAASRG